MSVSVKQEVKEEIDIPPCAVNPPPPCSKLNVKDEIKTEIVKDEFVFVAGGETTSASAAAEQYGAVFEGWRAIPEEYSSYDLLPPGCKPVPPGWIHVHPKWRAVPGDWKVIQHPTTRGARARNYNKDSSVRIPKFRVPKLPNLNLPYIPSPTHPLPPGWQVLLPPGWGMVWPGTKVAPPTWRRYPCEWEVIPPRRGPA